MSLQNDIGKLSIPKILRIQKQNSNWCSKVLQRITKFWLEAASWQNLDETFCLFTLLTYKHA